jgi:hypothetical protein
MEQEDLEMIAKDSPQVLVDAIRKCGQNVFKTHRDESVIV